MAEKKKLYDYDPKELNDDLLHTRYSALTAKLTLTCEELIARHKAHADLARTINETDVLGNLPVAQKQENIRLAAEFDQSSEHARALHTALVAELSHIKGRVVK
jgi:hypothetical protein